ncbi:MAG: hypothetical protein E2O67_04025 [Deltaproteobacteria bacterium]|nr:hypothetical protein [Candidatus Dadabacteria bacterium]TDJ06272.1 MAG: hypothetical protein E2O67_04025 [Deltaproteobacteria bacterium]
MVAIKKKWFCLAFILLLTVLYIYSYSSVKSKYSRISSVGTKYILLEQEKTSHKFMHYFFYPAFWIDYKFTGQEYGMLTLEDPYWIFTS